MSVINKMLRDLDSRQAQGVTAVAGPGGEQQAMQGTVSVAPPGAPAPTDARRYLAWLTALALLVGAILMVQRLGAGDPAAPTPAAAGTATPMAQAVTATPAVQSARAMPTAAVAPASAAQPAALMASASATAAARPGPESVAIMAAAPAPSAPMASAPTKAATRGAGAIVPVAVATAPATRVVASATASATAPALQRLAAASAETASVTRGASQSGTTAPLEPMAGSRQGMAQATLAQAQGLWNSGARQPAIDLLREAVAGAARAEPSGATGDGSLAALVRELARMELAQGQVAQVLDMLTRLEPALASQPELWAMRGNAAQRLARYAESVIAYQSALKLRPEEPRWMLGMAVSMAADGQTAAAAQWAERARDSGPLSPDVLAYLRQMGVNLRER